MSDDEKESLGEIIGNLVDKEMNDMRERKDAAYVERNQVVAAFARACLALGYDVVRGLHEGPEDFGEWTHVIRINLPTGQVSWHYLAKEDYLFKGIPKGECKWDGHTTPEKYKRLHAWKPGTYFEHAQQPEDK